MPTYVFSRSRPAGKSEGVIFTDQTPAAFVDAICKQAQGKNILVMGGGELARSFLLDDVVDELYIGVYPVLLGRRHPFYPERLPAARFQAGGQQELRAGRLSGTEILKDPPIDRAAATNGT